MEKLRYVTDVMPGISRRRMGRHFSYRRADGSLVRDPRGLARIKSLAIPPAWTHVWICPTPYGHLQATGRDARGRKVYRYHHEFRAARDEVKFDQLAAFGRALPRIRRRIEADLSRPGLSREKVLATIVALLDAAQIRVGNDEYARQNGSFGLTTLRDRHARVSGQTIRLRFRGKSGRVHNIGLSDRRLARIVARCQELPGQMLFQYIEDDGEPTAVASEDVNAYLREITDGQFTSKVFRTWAATVFAAEALAAMGPPESQSEAKRNLVTAIDATAERLGNTRAVCRSSYIHPLIIESYEGGITADAFRDKAPARGLSTAERAVLALLARTKQRRAA